MQEVQQPRRDYHPQQQQPQQQPQQQQQQQQQPIYQGLQQPSHQLHAPPYSSALSGPETASLSGYHHQGLPPPQITQPNLNLPHLSSIPSMNGMNNGIGHGMNGIGNGMMSMNGQHAPIMAPPQQQPQQPPPLTPQSYVKDGKSFSLEVKQQPVRARMCGFGDKDRRPITPPPCIKLVIRDATTGQELDPTDDTNSFVLLVDLWDETGTQEVSLVRHSNSSPAISISAATTAPYPPPVERPYLGLLDPAQLQAYYASIGDQATAHNLTRYLPAHHRQLQQQQQQAAMYGQPVPPGYPQQFPVPGQPYMHNNTNTIPIPIIPTPSQGMFTKNLIGSLCANATRLNDPENKPGYWFILQDLSVRTEGMFRLKLSFVDISALPGSSEPVNKGKVPVLALTYTEPFQVYSAKKFPGVIESTELSKCFAGQGIKIPIRKDGNNRGVPNAAEYDADEQ